MHSESNGHIDDADLVLAALVGDLRAFDELTIRYRPAMLIVAEQIVGAASGAEDVVQDALLLAYKALPQLDDAVRFPSWLYAITRHRALRYAKEDRRTRWHSDMELYLLTHNRFIAPDPAQLFEIEHTQGVLYDAITMLPSDHQLVLALYYWDEMPQQRIADFLGVPLTTVKWRLHRARRLLKQYIKTKEERE